MTFSLNIQLTISTFFNYYCFISFHCSSISRFYHACDKAKIYNSRNWYSMVCGVSAIKRCIRTCENQQKDLSFPVGQRERRSDKGRANNNSTNTPKRKICIIKGTRTSKFYIIFFLFSQRVVICLHSIFYYHGYFQHAEYIFQDISFVVILVSMTLN